MLTLFLVAAVTLVFNVQPAEAEPKTWTVDDDGPADFSSIQEAINSPQVVNGDTIFVYNGTYHENIVVNKTISLIGEEKDITVIDGGSVSDSVTVKVIAENVVLRGFTTKVSGFPSINILVNETANIVIANNNIIGGGPFIGGVKVCESTNVTLTENNIRGSGFGFVISNSSYIFVSRNNIAPPGEAYVSTGIGILRSFYNVLTDNNLLNVNTGIVLSESSNNTITDNYITGIQGTGIRIGRYPGENISSYNTFHNNTVKNCYYAILTGFFIGEGGHSNNVFLQNTVKNNHYGVFWANSSNNIFYFNNFINNTIQVYNEEAVNVWDNAYPFGGNYWSDYNGTDLYNGPGQNEVGSDGIGDSPYVIDETNVDNYPLMGPFSSFNTSLNHFVDIVSNSTIEVFEFFESNSMIRIIVSSMTANQTFGFCRLTIPHTLIAPPYNITVNNNSVKYYTIFENETQSIIYFNYEHSTLEIIIMPEFPSGMLLLALLTLLTVTLIFAKKNAEKRASFQNPFF